MGILIVLAAISLFANRVRIENSKTKLHICGAVAFCFAFSLILNAYLEYVLGWEYGIPGADLQNFFDAAQAISKGESITNLSNVHSVFSLKLSNLGYITYAYFIALVSFSPVIVSIRFSLQLVYFIQSLVAITTALNVADFFEDRKNKSKNYYRLFWMCIACTSVLQQSSILMRDVWIIFFISLLLQECKKKNSSLIRCIIYIAITALMRFYTLIIIIPIFIAFYFKKKKTAVIASFGIVGVFVIGTMLIDALASWFGVLWEYDYQFGIWQMLEYLLFPNVISQTQSVQNMDTSYRALIGGNTEWIYYMLSCWNVFVYPVAAYGGLQCIKRREYQDVLFWGMLMINIAMLYSVFYNAISEPRHKLMLIFSLMFFYAEGIKKMSLRARIIYFLLVILLLLLIFIVV